MTMSGTFSLAAGASARYENVLSAVYGAEPDVVGALALSADNADLIAMSRTYNIPGTKVAGTFGQELPGIPADVMIPSGERRRIIFMSEDGDVRSNVGCQNGINAEVVINIQLFRADGTSLETKYMTLAPRSNNQINRIFRNYAPVNGYVDVWTDTPGATFYCYGSVLDNLTSDPTTILPITPSTGLNYFIPAAALAAGAQGAFFQTDVDVNNKGGTSASYSFAWLPRGSDNSQPFTSGTYTLGPGRSARFENVLSEVFVAEPDIAGALLISSSSRNLIAMSRTYNLPGGKVAGTFGQALPGVQSDRLIPAGQKRRIVFMSENDDLRANIGCQNGVNAPIRINIELRDGTGQLLDTRNMDLAPRANNQINRIFRNYAPVNGYVDVWTDTPGATFYCYGSVLDNLTSDPTTILPQ